MTGHPMSDRPRGHAAIKTMATEMGTTMPELLVLARGNDPFCSGTPADEKAAVWFAELWTENGGGGHLRRLHYALVSTGAVQSDGTPYENTEKCWQKLMSASATARAMGLVDPTTVVDRRNPPPNLHPADPRPTPHPRAEHWGAPSWSVPVVDTDLASDAYYPIGLPEVDGYDYQLEDQPVLVEVWVEKSTMNDILLPLCRGLGANLVATIGFASITSAVDLLRRAREADKPARVLYVSDFDPGGHQMPVAVARQVEFWADVYAPGADIKVTPVVLTREQVAAYDLPRTPIKESDRRRTSFEARHGDGAVELDALEALHPGELARVVRTAIAPYRDHTLYRRLDLAEQEARTVSRRAWRETVATEQADLLQIGQDVGNIVSGYQAELEDLAARMAADLAGYDERLSRVWHAVQAKAAGFRVDLPPRPEGEIGDTDESAWLFDNGRPYMDQLDVYRCHRDGREVA